VRREERPLSSVPAWLWLALAACLATQLLLHAGRPGGDSARAGLPPPPLPDAMRLASFGEPEALARLTGLYLQGFETSRLDAARLTGWLAATLALDPRNGYPLFLAARVFSETADAARTRALLEFVHREFLRDPNRRWPWLAHTTLIAKHRLKDLPLARRYAADLQRLVSAQGVPLWVTQMEAFILEDMNELEAAKVLLGGLLASGRIQDPAEARFLQERLQALEARAARGR
jgi:hypothetical protein